ncbi:hypothetical protein [Cytobacillus firmus]|uniref:hypothetical protein n=1 Tax=Cytobacillus firmus TaxID=1399 RepID=UPI0018CDC478|nr:hypothetical protein [Cytobacillus firmus]MBG9657076.1 hypothetical protein [Cytobacillus firmus]MED1906749.1 hypothetical protein [Cytobacillus firmus]
MWYRVELKRKHFTLGRYHGSDVDVAIHYIHKWREVVEQNEAQQFQVSINTNDKTFSDRLKSLV